MPKASELELPDLVAGIVEDSRTLVEAQLGSLRGELRERVADLGTTIRSWLIAFTVAIVTLVMLGLALAASVHALGLGWLGSLWSVTALACLAVIALVYRARAASAPALDAAGALPAAALTTTRP